MSRFPPLKNRLRSAALTLLLTLSSGAVTAAGPFVVHLYESGEGGQRQPLPSRYVHLSARQATTDGEGGAVFEGLPAGAYRLRIREPGYAAIEREIQIPAGQREPLELELTPAPPIDWGGRVRVTGSEIPIAGAAIHLKPLKVAAAIAGPVAMVSGWEGEFESVGIAPGRYELRAEAPGFAPLRQELEVAATDPPDRQLTLALQPLSSPAALALELADGVTGDAIPGAAIEVAESWPDGLIATTQSDPGGRVRLDGLRIGAVNQPDADGKISIARRRITVHATADGYASRTVPADLDANPAPLRIELQPVTEQPEAEPNNDLNAAQPIRIGAPVTLAFAERGDHDLFRLRLDHPARLVVTVGPDNPLETHLRLLDGEGKLLQESGTHSGKTNRIERWVGAGDAFIELSEWGDNHFDPAQTLRLLVEAEPAVDPREPNDTTDAASPLQLGEQPSGLIWPVGDHDLYRLQIPRPGVIRIRDRAIPMERHLRLLDANGTLLGEQGVYANQTLDLQRKVVPGPVTIEILEWGNNSASLTPYRLRVDLLPDDGVDDPPLTAGRIAAARVLRPGDSVGDTLLPQGDIDGWSLSVPGPGRLRIQSRGRLERHVQLFAADGRLLVEQGVYGDQVNDLSWFSEGPESYLLTIREWGDNHWSPTAYALSAWFEPADEQESVRRNDGIAQATPILPGDTLHGSYLPRGDRDSYALELEHPGYLRVTAGSSHETHLRIFDASGQLVQEQGVYGGQTADLRPEVSPGLYYLMVGEWGDNAASPAPYTLTARLERAEPEESVPLADDAPRELADGLARSFAIDQRGDRDRFLFEATAPGPLTLHVAAPLETLIRVYDDATGARLHESGHYAPTRAALPLELKEPTRLRIELSEWGDNNASLDHGFVMVDSRGRGLQVDPVTATRDPERPRRVAFSRTRPAYTDPPQRCTLDLNGDGRPELNLADERPQSGELPKEGWQVIEAHCSGTDGQASVERLWVDASGPRDRAGLSLFLSGVGEGQELAYPAEISAQAINYDGRAIRRVGFELDGRALPPDYDPPYTAAIDWQGLGAGDHRIKVQATDEAGSGKEIERSFRLSPFFDLQPRDGATVTGEAVRVSWRAPGFGPTRLRYRKEGEQAWQEQTGPSGTLRGLALNGLEPTVRYEIQPLDGEQAGPLVRFTRVKGLAFGRPRYGANIRRDYDQRVGISVRNNGDQPLTVHLECGQPQDPLLLVGFVGDGSADRPFPLAPGEEREFLLGISAQDVNTEEHRFPVRIVSDNGLSDQAEVALHVRLPHVELGWEDLGPAPLGQGRRLRLVNRGDAITDLAVTSAAGDAITIHPTVRHGLLPEGGSMEFTVTPRLYEGFRGVKTRIVAQGLEHRFEHPYELKLAPGESARRVWLIPGRDPSVAGEIDPTLVRRAEEAQRLDPSRLDWGQRQGGDDLDGDGRPDRWLLQEGDLRWVGDDTDGDDRVDFVHADLGADGVYEYSALLVGDRWHPTNLVEAWLEMGFSLPWNRSEYHPHDANVVLNGQVIGRLRDTIPEGNYRFRIPPAALRFDPSGRPGDNQVGIVSQHLRGGHYVVNSDFRFKFRLTATPVWTVAKSEAEARQAAGAIAGLSVSAPDLSLSSAELRLDAPAEPKAGDGLSVEIPLRNLGSQAPQGVEVGLFRLHPDGRREELARQTVEQAPLDGALPVRIDWKVNGGANRLALVADPDNKLTEIDRSNNEALFFVQASGDDTPPTLKLQRPTNGARPPEPLVTLEYAMEDDSGSVQGQFAIDGGLWQPLPLEAGHGVQELLLQPGPHRVELRALDGSGHEAREAIELQVTATPPEAEILEPAAGARIDARRVTVVVRSPADAALIAVRLSGGPWYRAGLIGDQGRLELPLPFGPQTIEVMVADKRGAVSTLDRAIEGTRQAAADEPPVVVAGDHSGMLWPADRPDLEIDLFEGHNGVLKRLQLPAAERAQRLLEDARRLQAQGDYAGALARYRESLVLQPAPQVEERARKLEAYLGVKR